MGNGSNVPLLEKLVNRKQFSIAQIHALWIMEGLDALTAPLLTTACKQQNTALSGLAFYLLDRIDLKASPILANKLASKLFERNDPKLDLYLAAAFGALPFEEEVNVFSFYKELETRYSENKTFAELAFSNLSGKEEAFLKQIQISKSNIWKDLGQEILNNIKTDKKNKEMFPAVDNPHGDKRQKGLEEYRQYCASCHGEDGNGVENSAPPLYDSDYVAGNTDRLALIILHGLEGPVHIKGKRYEFNAVMPGIRHNPDLSDKDILSIIAFIRNAFSAPTDFMGPTLDEKRLQQLRKKTAPNDGLYTEKLLEEMFK